MTRNVWKGFQIAFVFGFVGTSIAQTRTVPEDREIELVGVIREVHGFGPPGYGEDKKSDSRITYWALELRTAVTTPCTPERPDRKSNDCSFANRLRMFFPELPNGSKLEEKARIARNRRMLVKGILHRSDTAGEITPIYIDVIQIESSTR